MRRAAAVALAGSALWVAPDAVATPLSRFEVHLRVVPVAVAPGKLVHVRFTVYALTSQGRVLSDRWQFRLVAISPRSTRIRIGLHRVARGTWTGTIRPRTLGTWQIRVADWRSAGTGPIVKVKVREPAPTTSTPIP